MYGHMNINYIPENFYNTFIMYPFPNRAREGMGGSLFLLTPLFVLSLRTLRHVTRSIAVLWGTMILAALPGLLLLGGGYFQFGPRYSIDYMPPLLLLTGLGMPRLPRWIAPILVAISCGHYIVGSLLFP